MQIPAFGWFGPQGTANVMYLTGSDSERALQEIGWCGSGRKQDHRLAQVLQSTNSLDPLHSRVYHAHGRAYMC